MSASNSHNTLLAEKRGPGSGDIQPIHAAPAQAHAAGEEGVPLLVAAEEHIARHRRRVHGRQELEIAAVGEIAQVGIHGAWHERPCFLTFVGPGREACTRCNCRCVSIVPVHCGTGALKACNMPSLAPTYTMPARVACAAHESAAKVCAPVTASGGVYRAEGGPAVAIIAGGAGHIHRVRMQDRAQDVGPRAIVVPVVPSLLLSPNR